jgi:multiple sugar transport system substrate-binding protein/putative aldouronate transport system substrate-binding protein
MSLTRKQFLSLAAITGAGAAMSGCSLSGGSSTGSGSTTTADTSVLDNKDTISLTVFSQTANFSGAQAGWSAALLKDKFNIELTIIPDVNGTFETRMQKGDLGDIVVFGDNGTDYKEAIDKGLLYDWEDEDLVKNYGPDIESYFSDSLEANRTISGDDKIHGIANYLTNKSGEHDMFSYEWGLRWDLYEQLGYPEIKDWDGLIDVLGKMKALCPTGDTGDSTYGLSIWPDWDGNMVMYVKALASGYYGYDELGFGLYDSSNGDFYDALEEDGPYLKALKFCNKMYRAGLLDPDSMTQTYDTMISKAQNGDVLFSLFNYAGTIAFNKDAHVAKNEWFAPKAPDDAHTIVYGLAPCGQTRIWSIGAKTQYPEKCMQLLNYLCSPTGAMGIWYGIKGLMWDYDDNKNTYFTDLGKTCYSDATTDMTGTTWTGESGTSYDLSGTFNDGLLQANNITWAPGADNPDSNGERFDEVFWKSTVADPKCDAESDWRDKTGANNTQEYLESTNFSVVAAANYAADEKDSELELKWSQVKTAICNGSWKAMYADDDASFESLVSDMRSTCSGYGYDDCVSWCKDQAEKRYGLQES